MQTGPTTSLDRWSEPRGGGDAALHPNTSSRTPTPHVPLSTVKSPTYPIPGSVSRAQTSLSVLATWGDQLSLLFLHYRAPQTPQELGAARPEHLDDVQARLRVL